MYFVPGLSIFPGYSPVHFALSISITKLSLVKAIAPTPKQLLINANSSLNPGVPKMRKVLELIHIIKFVWPSQKTRTLPLKHKS